jgi:hypothetical protein
MDKLTDFTDTTDVSDAAIEWVVNASGYYARPCEVRRDARDECHDDCAIIIAARLIQQHRPELLVDPVDAIIDEKMRDAGFISSEMRDAAKRLYQMGLEAGKGQCNA